MLRDTLFLDLSPGSAQLLLANKRGKKTCIIHAESYALPGDMFADDVPNVASLGAFLSMRMKEAHRHPRYAYLLLPDPFCFLFSVTTQPHNAHLMDDAIRWESTQHIPFPLATATIDWHPAIKRPEGIRIEVAATQNAIAEAYAATAEAANLVPIHIEPRSLALFRAFRETRVADPLLLIAVNQQWTTLFHQTNDGIPLLATIPTFSLERCIATLNERLRLERNDAEKALTVYGLSATIGEGVIRSALKDELEALKSEIERYDTFVGKTASSFFVTSSDLRIAGIQEAITEMTQKTPLPVVREPFEWSINISDETKRRFSPLCGAVNGFYENDKV